MQWLLLCNLLITEVGNRSHKVSKDLVYIFFVPFLLLRIFWHGDKDISAGDGLASIRNIKAARKKNASVHKEQLQKRPLNLNFLLCSQTRALKGNFLRRHLRCKIIIGLLLFFFQTSHGKTAM